VKFTKPQLISRYTLSEEQTGNHSKQELAYEDDNIEVIYQIKPVIRKLRLKTRASHALEYRNSITVILIKLFMPPLEDYKIEKTALQPFFHSFIANLTYKTH
jgi:hypothetical protein